jgi:ABC-type uncharacterized transport system auxiliary subunit
MTFSTPRPLRYAAIALFAFFAIFLGACNIPGPNAQGGYNYWMQDKAPVPAHCCSHGDTLNIVLEPSQGQAYCNDLGGKYEVLPNGVKTCNGVDF